MEWKRKHQYRRSLENFSGNVIPPPWQYYFGLSESTCEITSTHLEHQHNFYTSNSNWLDQKFASSVNFFASCHFHPLARLGLCVFSEVPSFGLPIPFFSCLGSMVVDSKIRLRIFLFPSSLLLYYGQFYPYCTSTMHL
jgi:hypothetical protein